MNDPIYARVAVCLDGSPRALDALGPARRLARLHGARLWLVTVDDGYDDPQDRLDASGLLHDELVGGATVLDMQGSTAETLGRFDDEHPETLVCLTTRGRNPVGRALLGSVASGVVRHSSQAVALVGPRCSRTAESAISRLIVALDTTTEAETALDWAVRWATHTTTPLTLVQVIDPMPPPDAKVAPSSETMETVRYLPRVGRELRAAGHELLEIRTQHADTPEAIVEAAETFDRAVVFVARTDRHPVAEVVLGSVTASVVNASPVPVIITPRSA